MSPFLLDKCSQFIEDFTSVFPFLFDVPVHPNKKMLIRNKDHFDNAKKRFMKFIILYIGLN